MLTLLLTRPAAQANAFAAALSAHIPGRFRTIVSPLLSIQLHGHLPDLDDVSAVAFTSANGVKAYIAAGGAPHYVAFCVGTGTAAAAAEAGFRVHSAHGDAAALTTLIARARPESVLHVRGMHAAADLTAMLNERGIPSREAILYDQRPDEPSGEASALGKAGLIDVVTAFSPRSASLLAQAAAEWQLDHTRSVAISMAADAPLAGLLPLQRRLVSHTPDRDGMMAALASL